MIVHGVRIFALNTQSTPPLTSLQPAAAETAGAKGGHAFVKKTEMSTDDLRLPMADDCSRREHPQGALVQYQYESYNLRDHTDRSSVSYWVNTRMRPFRYVLCAIVRGQAGQGEGLVPSCTCGSVSLTRSLLCGREGLDPPVPPRGPLQPPQLPRRVHLHPHPRRRRRSPGPPRCCPPRHLMPFDSTTEGAAKRV
jgi:hypothetical protein